MRRVCLLGTLIVVAAALLAGSPVFSGSHGLKAGNPQIESMGSLAFSPEGILFVGDSQGGAVFALDVSDMAAPGEKPIDVEGVDEKIAAALGTSVKDVRIHDLAVHPVTRRAYLTVSREGKDLLLRINAAGEVEDVPLENVKYAKKTLANPIAKDAVDRRGRSRRSEAISDLAFREGKLYIAGLSNEEFSSTLRVVSFPFANSDQATSLEIFHAAHKRYETNSPVRTLLPYDLAGEPHVLAAYTCTPLVTFPANAVKSGTHLKGKTVAELGSGNRPLDMIAYKNDGKDYILIANSNRTLMKIDPMDIASAESITTPVEGRYETAGVKFVAINQVGVQQVDDYDDDNVLVVQRMSNGLLNLHAIRKARL